jgi:DNA-binding YbaB/EbfC family protein
MFKGGMPNMQNMMKQVQKMQDAMAKVQAELEHKTVTGDAGGGMVKATANGKQQLTALTIEPDVIDKEEKDILEDLVVAAVNQALEKAAALSQEEMKKATGGMMPSIPGMPGFGG